MLPRTGKRRAPFVVGPLIVLTLALLYACTAPAPEATLAPDLDVPAEVVLTDWDAATRISGVPLFATPDEGEPRLIARGVAGDRYRPIWAAYPSGLLLIETHRSVLPGPSEDELLDVPGADEAWAADVDGTRYFYARRGETLVILTGATDARLRAAAGSLRTVSP